MPGKNLPSEVDVVVCGAGIVGAAICYYLTKNTSLKVLCLEKEHKGSGSTQRSAAAFRQQFSSQTNIQLSLYSGKMYRQFSKEFGLNEEVFTQNGYLFLYSDEKLWEDALKRFEYQKSMGLKEVECLAGKSLFDRFPEVRSDENEGFKVLGATFCQSDGFLDPVLVCQSYLRKALEAGLLLSEYTPLEQIETTNGEVSAVVADGQTIKTPLLINASGAWANELLRSIGLAVPVVPVKRYLYTSNQLARDITQLPLIVANLGAYVRPEIRGLMLGWDEKPAKPENSKTFDPEPAPFTPDYDTDEGYGAKNLEGYGYQILFELAEFLPFIETEVNLEAVTCGYYQVSPDDKAILGDDPRLKGLVHAIGFSGHGVMHAPAIGDQICQWIQGKKTSIDWKESLVIDSLLKNESRSDPEIMVI